MKRRQLFAALSASISLLAFASIFPARADDEDSAASRSARWKDIEQTIFADKEATSDSSVIGLEAPYRAEDAALVPITITLNSKQAVKDLYLVIDDNPSPVAAHYTFGPAADPHRIEMRVRVDSYTNIHAVARLGDGRLVEAVKFVKAAGGCSAPMGMSDDQAMKGMGQIRMKFGQDVVLGKPMEATLMVRHPMFNGMQMNQVTRLYTPARYIESMTVSEGNELVFDLSTSISLSTNPVIIFGFVPKGAPMTVSVTDNKSGHWEKSFPVPTITN